MQKGIKLLEDMEKILIERLERYFAIYNTMLSAYPLNTM
jgi:hypothetical protein